MQMTVQLKKNIKENYLSDYRKFFHSLLEVMQQQSVSGWLQVGQLSSSVGESGESRKSANSSSQCGVVELIVDSCVASGSTDATMVR